MPGALVLGVWLLAVPLGGGEPGLLETQEAAASAAGGSAALDAARLARARAAHWVPQIRGQATVREDEKTRLGEYRLAPLREQDAGAGRNWALTLTWDLSQVVFAREETQLAQTQAQLAKIRREAADKAAQLWIERQKARVVFLASRSRESCFAMLRATAALFAITGGLFREVAVREEATCAGELK